MSQPVTRHWRQLTRITLRGANPAQPHGQGACDRPPHVRRGAPTRKLQKPVQLHRRESRTNEDAMPIPYAASSETAPTWCEPRLTTARKSWLPVTNGPTTQSQNHQARPATWLHEFRVCCFFPPANPFKCHTILVSSSPCGYTFALNCRKVVSTTSCTPPKSGRPSATHLQSLLS